MNTETLSDNFRDLANFFRQIAFDESGDRESRLRSAQARGGKLIKRAADAGIIAINNHRWPKAKKLFIHRPEEEQARVPFDLDEFAWDSAWQRAIFRLSKKDPGFPCNPLSLKRHKIEPNKIISDGIPDAILYAQKMVEVADYLAARVEDVTEKKVRQNEIAPSKPGKPKKEATTNQRMMETIQKNPEAMGWNSPEWAKYLECAKSTVVETETWTNLESARLQEKASRTKDRRRKSKASDIRRD